MPPKRKKLADDRKNAAAKDLLDRETWPGWCEIESEPAYFNVMLRELGVDGIKIQDIVSLDDETMSALSQPVHALIFLFEYRQTDEQQPATNCPPGVWFASQVAESSCASVALLNIINNIPDLTLGPHLQSFRDFTATMTPVSRGHALESFAYLRTVHNSFARDLDMQHANLLLRNKHARINARLKGEARTKAREAREEELARDATTNFQRRSTRKRKIVEISDEDDEAPATEDTEPGFHFIAYIPIDGEVWSLDGMSRSPFRVGPVEDGRKWLDVARESIISRISEYGGEAISFTLLAAVHDSYVATQDRIKQGTPGNGCNGEIGQTSNGEPEMLELQCQLSRELESRQNDTNKVTLRRHDYRAFFTAWVDELKAMDVLEPLTVHVKAED